MRSPNMLGVRRWGFPVEQFEWAIQRCLPTQFADCDIPRRWEFLVDVDVADLSRANAQAFPDHLASKFVADFLDSY